MKPPTQTASTVQTKALPEIDDTSLAEISGEIDKIVVLQSSEDGTAVSFQIHQEDHTLGNALRYIIMKNPDVEFCGYSIPHPSEPKLNVRIQTWDGVKASDVLLKGLDDLVDMCNVIETKFKEAIEAS